jgi:1-acyl-sn-glycerol-3-phosphate acyltransferase
MIYITSALRWLVGLPLTVLVLLLITISAVLLPPGLYNNPGRALLRWLVRLYGGRVVVQGLENLDPQAGYLFMSNHVSLFDVPVLGGVLPNYTRGLEAAEQFNYPVLGWFLRAIGNIPISRKNARASWASMQRAAEEISKGTSIIILPEGTRTRTGELGPFKKMPFRLAKMAKAPIVAIGMSGLYHFKRRASWLLRPGLIKVRIGRPIPIQEISRFELEELCQLVRDRISELIEYP